jgi:hypothetical protein
MPVRKAEFIAPDVRSKALEMYYQENATVSQVHEYVKSQGYDIGRMTIWQMLKRSKEYAPHAIETMIKGQNMTSNEGLDHLMGYLTIINDSLHALLQAEGGVSPAQLPKVLLAISEGRKTLEAIERVQAKMPKTVIDPQELYDRLVEVMREAKVPVEYVEQIAKLWEAKYGNGQPSKVASVATQAK